LTAARFAARPPRYPRPHHASSSARVRAVTEFVGSLGETAANDVTVQQLSLSKAAAVVLVLAVTRSASAAESAHDYVMREGHAIMAIPVDATSNPQAGIGDDVDHDAFKRVVVGTAQVPRDP
jgi:hypothetical protein